MTRRRMLGAVKTATVVITNPTHFAVALEYRRSTMSAPVVVAKGKDLLAQRIKQIARDKGVPMIENVPLAQALYREAEVGAGDPRGSVRRGRRSARLPRANEASGAVGHS